MDQYNTYSASDFLEDEAFIRYIKYGRPADVAVWDDWLASGPASAEAFHAASEVLGIVLSARRIEPEQDDERLSWEVIERRTGEWDQRRRSWGRIRWVAAAAVIAVALASGAFWYLGSRVTVETGYGEQKEVVLPDRSIVRLNANSTLTWYRAWRWRKGREVWLKGEGLFDVGHGTGQFTAYAGDVAVSVLGTRFDVKQRRSVVVVSLLEGKLGIRDARRSGGQLILRAGETARFEDSSATVRVGPIRTMTSQPQAWADHKIMANGMTVRDIIENYEDSYGYHIVLGDTSQASKTIDGTLSLQTEDGVLYMLANILNANIHREGRTIYLQPKHN
ncbi:MAG: FecR domain-containing protein [Bacteroidetes bacterium]|nr:FecR domain-containing protein [Bacteroidota bacterium]